MSSSSWSARIAREPLVAFVLIGIGLFAIDRARARDDDARRIVIDAPFVEGLRTEAARRTGHVQGDAETSALIDAWVREEALYREARARSLDVGDTIVRRRLVQKMELLLAAEAVPHEPTDAELDAYLAAHQTDFESPPTSSITLCFVARELHDDPRAAAEAALASRREGDAAPCDPHLVGDVFRARTDAQLSALLGTGETVAALRSAEIGAWTGPYESVRGFYVVRVDARQPGGPRPVDEVRSAVASAWIEEHRSAAVRASERAIVSRYEVVRP